ncbi:ATP-grasp domain-containing protein [Streptomyces netropsis]|uniref:ATP-grasp domain-containing protein n=1 Tax=Streptomyces netropsis TaxID=55404 RepID=A0A7W7LCZ7_STRNE|nr:ATP-grasp domain-containing protein [Streptomyces netropsis]MBB4887396.1 hypothetical protein [Streptomyces netropsis]
MMRVVVLGEFRADRLVPLFEQRGADVAVLAFVGLEAFLGPGVECGMLPTELSECALLRLLDAYGADVAVPNLGCPGQEQFLPVYARAAPRVWAAGRRMPVHSEGFATLASDKVVLHRVAQERGWPVPRGVVCVTAREVREAGRGLGLPVLVKEARSEFHAGRHYVRDGDHLGRVSGEVTCPVLVQQAVEGDEYAIEFLSGSPHTVAWPVASLGRLDSACAPGTRVRVAPAALPTRAQAELTATVADMVKTFRPWGPWQMDFAVTDDGRLQLIEVNGRLGGVSNMSWASTGLDPHAVHAEAAFGRRPPSPQAGRVALELPVRNDMVLPPAPSGTELMCFPGNPANRGPCIGGFQRAVLGVPTDRAGVVREWLPTLPPGVLLNSPDEAAAQLSRGVHALRQGTPLVGW